MTGLVDRLERELYAARTARPRDSARYAAVLERAVRTCGADSEAADVFDLADLYLELATEYQALDRWEDALAAADAVIEAALDMRPDSRCLRAEILMRADRVAEAEPIWAAVLADTPDDVWLYNNAGLEYAHAGDQATALNWLTGGLRLALRTSDPERLVDELADLRQTSLDNLGRPADALQEQAMTFLREQEQASQKRSPQYCRAMQQQLVEYAEAGMPGMVIAPVQVAPFTAWCAERGHQPDSADARAEYAAHLAATADPGLIAWPPGRNQPCWCGSGRKYKKCCAAPTSVDADPHQ
jgi:tetratricopeptide (TPR) repeat protein